MKKKISVKVTINCDKCKKKAMKVASEAGADSVALEGESKDLLVVIGDQVDPACLTLALRKKLCYATLVGVEEVKPPKEEAKKEEAKKEDQIPTPFCPQPTFIVWDQCYEPSPSFCSIL
ncbi:hypothetical protein Taro_000227 [Colocasia esculenta]|uniref:Uncharacterized protein n=1 Tax=Colocasia esculenta TaxID=4460 RepID=A0A843TH35_COLES|nr:hypothetical protein [Colocasia esculenta]